MAALTESQPEPMLLFYSHEPDTLASYRRSTPRSGARPSPGRDPPSAAAAAAVPANNGTAPRNGEGSGGRYSW
eukprot:COSAG05_NODE_538_length_8854_cov_306.308738_1_plen_72_part_10